MNNSEFNKKFLEENLYGAYEVLLFGVYDVCI